MTIDKIIFSTSEAFSCCWNWNAEAYAAMGIEPVCLLWGRRSHTDMSEKHGRVIEMAINPDIPLLLQITWSKFYWPSWEPNTTWMIGDIDLFPLQRAWFTHKIKHEPADAYLHLAADCITQLSGSPHTWVGDGSAQEPMGQNHAANLAAHYHVAKGSLFRDVLNQHGTFTDAMQHILNNRAKYGGTRDFRPEDPIDQAGLWCAEECRSTDLIRTAVLARTVKFMGFPLCLSRGADSQRIERGLFKGTAYDHHPDWLSAGKYVDLHAGRPFADCRAATERMLQIAGMIG